MTSGKAGRTLGPLILKLARRVVELVGTDNVWAWYHIGMVHWLRYHALPEGEDQLDLKEALSAFARVYPRAPHLVPDQVRSVLGAFPGQDPTVASDAASANSQALVLLRDPCTASDVGALDRAVALLQRAVAITPVGHPHLAMYLSNLCGALRTRHERTGEFADIDGAVYTGKQAVTATWTHHPERALCLHNLGLALRMRYERTGARADLNEAVNAGRQAVEITPVDDPDHAGRLSGLGLALQVRFERSGVLDDLNEAVDAGRQAAATTPSTTLAARGFYPTSA